MLPLYLADTSTAPCRRPLPHGRVPRRAARAARRQHQASVPGGAAAAPTQRGPEGPEVNEASRLSGGPLSGVTDGLSALAFAALHAFDDCGVTTATATEREREREREREGSAYFRGARAYPTAAAPRLFVIMKRPCFSFVISVLF